MRHRHVQPGRASSRPRARDVDIPRQRATSCPQRSSSLAQTLQRAASAASSLWRGDSRGGSSGDSSPRELAAGPRVEGATAVALEARRILKTAATNAVAPIQSRCQCPQHRAKAAAAAAAAKAAATAAVKADPAVKVEAGKPVADSQPLVPDQPREHLPLSFPVPWLAQQPERAAAADSEDAIVLSVAKASPSISSLSEHISSQH